MLVQACTGRKIPKGKLPADVGCLVVNITSVAFLANYLKTGMPLVTKRLTVDGSAVAEPKNVIVPIGISIHDLIAFCGGYRETPAKILMGWMQQAQHFAFQQPSVHTQARLLIRRHLFLDQWKQSMIRH